MKGEYTMKQLLMVLVVGTMLSWASPASAADIEQTGDVPQAQLSELGLASMEVLPEEAGLDIRGKGFVIPINLGNFRLPNLYLPFLILPTEGIILNTPYGSFRFQLPFRFNI